MFGDLLGAMSTLKNLKTEVAEVKTRLDQTGLRIQSPNQQITIQGTANKCIQKIDINPELLLKPQELELQLIAAVNQFVRSAENWQHDEIQKVVKEKLPNIPGIEHLLK
jgi:DNA-binding protein YbaB